MVEVASKQRGKLVTGCRARGGRSGPAASTVPSWDLLLLPRNRPPLLDSWTMGTFHKAQVGTLDKCRVHARLCTSHACPLRTAPDLMFRRDLTSGWGLGGCWVGNCFLWPLILFSHLWGKDLPNSETPTTGERKAPWGHWAPGSSSACSHPSWTFSPSCAK